MMVSWYCLLSLYFAVCPFLVRADSSSDDIDLVWQTDGFEDTVRYENVDLQQSSLLAVCLAVQYDNKSNDGEIFFIGRSGAEKFEWKTYGGSSASSRIHCQGHVGEATDNICYTHNKANCQSSSTEQEHLSFGYCEEAQSIIFSSDNFSISCGDTIETVPRCSDESEENLGPWNIIVKSFTTWKCATRLRPVNSKWIDVLSGNVDKTINFESRDLLIQELVIREGHKDRTTLIVRFKEIGTEDDIVKVTLQSDGRFLYQTEVSLNATVCGNEAADESKTLKQPIGNKLGRVKIRITSMGDRIVLLFDDTTKNYLLLPPCDKIRKNLTMVFENPSPNRNLSLVGNTNIKIVQKENCSEPSIKDYGLKLEDQTTTYLQIGSEVKLGCEDPKYQILTDNVITCQINKTWTPIEFPQCTRKKCEVDEYVTLEGICTACPQGDCSLTMSICSETKLKEHDLKLKTTNESYKVGSDVRVDCVDPMTQIVGNDLVYCESIFNHTLELPSCTKKTCDLGEYLASDGSCTESTCPRGQYASEGSGACLDCKTEGDKNYADTEGSSSCKQCDGEVDSGRTFCLQRDRTLPPSDDAESETKRFIYIALGVVAVVVHAVALGIIKWRSEYSLPQKHGPEHFARRFKMYNTPKITDRIFSKHEPEISIQYTFPEALLALEGKKSREETEKAASTSRKQTKSGSDSDNNQTTSSQNKMDVKDNGEPDPLYDDLEGFNSTCTSAKEKPADQSMSKDTDAEPTYLGISEIPFPSQVDQSNESGKRTLDKNEVGPEVKKSATLKKMKTFKDLALNTLKKDGTLKKDLTEKKSATLSKKENTLRRNTIKKSDNADKRSLPLEKDFADLEKMIQFDDWTEDAEDSTASNSVGQDEIDDADMDVSYSDNTRTDANGVERYTPLGSENEGILYTRSTKFAETKSESAKRQDQE